LCGARVALRDNGPAPFFEAELKHKLDAPECEIRVLIRGIGKAAFGRAI
jgi:hypothetical protein